MQDIELIKKFIIDNGLQFTEGRRNSDSIMLSGFALYLGYDKPSALTLLIKETLPDAKEFDVDLIIAFNYARKNNYGNWWAKEENRKMYKLD